MQSYIIEEWASNLEPENHTIKATSLNDAQEQALHYKQHSGSLLVIANSHGNMLAIYSDDKKWSRH